MRWTLLSTTLQVESIIRLPASKATKYMLKVNNKNAKKRWEICSKLTTKTPERGSFSSVSFSDFERVNVFWVPVYNNPVSYQKQKLSVLFNLEQQKHNQPKIDMEIENIWSSPSTTVKVFLFCYMKIYFKLYSFVVTSNPAPNPTLHA